MRWSFAQKARACTDTTLRLCQPPRDATYEPENRRKGPRRAESRQDNTSLPFPLPLAVPMLKDARASSSRAWTLFYNNAALGGRRHKRILDRSVDDRAKGTGIPYRDVHVRRCKAAVYSFSSPTRGGRGNSRYQLDWE